MLFCTAGISSRIGVTFWIFVILITIEIVCSTTPSSRSPESTSRDRKSQINPGSIFNPCDITTDNNETKDANSACRSECLAVQAKISKTFNANKSSKGIKLLYNICGKATGGRTVTFGPACWCETPKSLSGCRRIPVKLCLYATQRMRKSFNPEITAAADNPVKSNSRKQANSHKIDAGFEEVRMFRFNPENDRQNTGSQAPLFRPESTFPRPHTPFLRPRVGLQTQGSISQPSASAAYTRPSTTLSPDAPPFTPAAQTSVLSSSPPPRPTEKDWNTKRDNQPEGLTLVTDVRIGRSIVRAIVDTGSGTTLIHPNYAKDVTALTEVPFVTTADHQSHKIDGETTIDVEIRREMTVSVSGLVTTLSPGLLLGVDFFFAYAAKIWISEELMQISVQGRRVAIIVKLRTINFQCFKMLADLRIYKPMDIQIYLNGHPTRMVIDTGSAVTLVGPNFVENRPVRPSAHKVNFGSGSMGLKGETDIGIQVERIWMTYTAMVPAFIPTRSLITGNEFNKRYVELIDFMSRSVTVRFPDQSGRRVTSTRMFIFLGQ